MEKGHTVLKKNLLRQLLALLLPALHVSLQHLLRSRESGKSCSTFDIPTFRDHSGQLEVSPMGSSRSLVQIRWKRLGSSQVWGTLVRISLQTSPIDFGRGEQ